MVRRKLHRGSRGGLYYIRNGRKVYVSRRRNRVGETYFDKLPDELRLKIVDNLDHGDDFRNLSRAIPSMAPIAEESMSELKKRMIGEQELYKAVTNGDVEKLQKLLKSKYVKKDDIRFAMQMASLYKQDNIINVLKKVL